MVITFVSGACMGPAWDHVIAAVDPEAPIFSGDVVRLHVEHADGTRNHIVKRLECDRRGFWYAIADGDAPPTNVMPLILYKIISISKIVSRSPTAARPRVPEFTHWPSADSLKLIELFSRVAREEWMRFGHVRGVAFPGLDAVYRMSYPPTEIAA